MYMIFIYRYEFINYPSSGVWECSVLFINVEIIYISLIHNASFLHVVRALQWIIAGETFRLKVHMIDIYEVNYHTKGEFFFTFVLQICNILTMNRVFHILWNFFQDIVDICSAFKDLFFCCFYSWQNQSLG